MNIKLQIIEAGFYTKDGEKLIDLTKVTLKDASEFLVIKNGNK